VKMLARAALRSFVVSLAVVTIHGAIRFIDFRAFCNEAKRAGRGGNGALLPPGFAVALPGEEIAVCTSRHCLGSMEHPLACHEDIACYCFESRGSANATLYARALARGRMGPVSCTIVERSPSPADDSGPCPNTRCLEHVRVDP
jgi:hypothetical protein